MPMFKMMLRRYALSLIAVPVAAVPALAQDHSGHAMPGMEHAHGHQMPEPPEHAVAMEHGNHAALTGLLGGYPMSRDASGTSWQPDQAPHGGVHVMRGDWMLMGHLSLYGTVSSQSGPRGDDKTFVSGMAMGAARRDISAADTVNFRVMLSPDPLMGRSGYPLLLASGETADGVSHLVDRQHPHELVMEMSSSITHRFADSNSVFLYLGYPGEPALGPPAFMHRASAAANPAAPITHHWLDSTHITFGVATAGFVHENWKLEVSQFTGREPDQYRFNFDPPRFDSTALRLSWNPDPHWSLQASWGHLNSPEQLNPAQDENRTTASAQYFSHLGEQSSVAATLAWGQKRLRGGTNLNGVVLETTYKPSEPWSIFLRGEWTENAELDHAHSISPVAQLSLGAVHDWRLNENWKFGIGAQHSFIRAPGSLGYGGSPQGSMAFVRILAE